MSFWGEFALRPAIKAHYFLSLFKGKRISKKKSRKHGVLDSYSTLGGRIVHTANSQSKQHWESHLCEPKLADGDCSC